MNPWRYVPHKPWHFMVSHEETMECIRKTLTKQNKARQSENGRKARARGKGRQETPLLSDIEYGHGAIDIANEEKPA